MEKEPFGDGNHLGQIETAADVNIGPNYQYVSIEFIKTIFAVM